MVRVCKPGGHVIIIPDPSLADENNYYEWLCDQSHTRVLHPGEFEAYFRLFGMEVISARTRVLENEFLERMDFSLTEKKHREEILRAVRAELDGGPKTALGAYEEDSVLCFNQLGLSIVGRKPSRKNKRGSLLCATFRVSASGSTEVFQSDLPRLCDGAGVSEPLVGEV